MNSVGKCLINPLRALRILIRMIAWLALVVWAAPAIAAFTEETVFFDVPSDLVASPIPSASSQLLEHAAYPKDPARLTLIGRLYLPDPALHGPGPYPALMILHGSGGLWSKDRIQNGLTSQYQEWGKLLADLGYLALFPDSFNPRGISNNFMGRKPHYNPALDDHLCSPNYERPKDVVAAITYLQSRRDFDHLNVGIIGFSHGAQTAMNSIVDSSVQRNPYTVTYIKQVAIPDTHPVKYREVSILKPVPSPVRIPNGLPFPKICFFYYGGGSHYRYHGQASSTQAGRFMLDRRTKVIIFHGTKDYLMSVNNPEGPPPFTGKCFPIKQALASSAHAKAQGIEDPLKHHFLMNGVDHSFDMAPLAHKVDWNTPKESPNQKAKRLCRAEVLKWLRSNLDPLPDVPLDGGFFLKYRDFGL